MLVVRRNAAANQTVGCGKRFDQVDLAVHPPIDKGLGGVETTGAGAHYGDTDGHRFFGRLSIAFEYPAPAGIVSDFRGPSEWRSDAFRQAFLGSGAGQTNPLGWRGSN